MIFESEFSDELAEAEIFHKSVVRSGGRLAGMLAVIKSGGWNGLKVTVLEIRPGLLKIGAEIPDGVLTPLVAATGETVPKAGVAISTLL